MKYYSNFWNVIENYGKAWKTMEDYAKIMENYGILLKINSWNVYGNEKYGIYEKFQRFWKVWKIRKIY